VTDQWFSPGTRKYEGLDPVLIHYNETNYSIYGWFGLWCLTPLSTILQLYRGGQFYWSNQIYKLFYIIAYVKR
jgi:hypothetical protein